MSATTSSARDSKFGMNLEDLDDIAAVKSTSNVDVSNGENYIQRGKVTWHRRVFGDVHSKRFESKIGPFSYHSDEEDVAHEVYCVISLVL